MRLCRFADDQLGVVIGDRVHNVTDTQSEIRKVARYDMKGDAVIAALPEWRKRIRHDGPSFSREALLGVARN